MIQSFESPYYLKIGITELGGYVIEYWRNQELVHRRYPATYHDLIGHDEITFVRTGDI